MDNFAKQFELFARSARYEKFIATLRHQFRSSGRLFFWQEKLIADFFAANNMPKPASLADLVGLFSNPSTSFELGNVGQAIQLTQISLLREFRSIKQHASGGSHLTVFEIEVSPNEDTGLCTLIDRAGPHEHPTVAEEILAAFANGIHHLSEQYKCLGKHFLGFNVTLLSYIYSESEFRPNKYEAAFYFLLKDILSESLTNRKVPRKLVGIPL